MEACYLWITPLLFKLKCPKAQSTCAKGLCECYKISFNFAKKYLAKVRRVCDKYAPFGAKNDPDVIITDDAPPMVAVGGKLTTILVSVGVAFLHRLWWKS